jgi:hypothetical protein
MRGKQPLRWEPPALAEGSWTFSPAEESSILKWALAPGSGRRRIGFQTPLTSTLSRKSCARQSSATLRRWQRNEGVNNIPPLFLTHPQKSFRWHTGKITPRELAVRTTYFGYAFGLAGWAKHSE